MTLDNDAIASLIEGYDKQTRALKEDALRLSWYMRGGLSYDDAMMLSNDEKRAINDIVKENLETTKKSNMPFF